MHDRGPTILESAACSVLGLGAARPVAARRRPAHCSRRRALERGNRYPGAVVLLAKNIYAVVRAIPRGKVVTYGEIAGLAGAPTGHRQVARAMRGCPERLPWQRVVGKKDARRAQINIDDPDHAALQRGLLESEGVRFDASGFISLGRFGWLWEPESPTEPDDRAGGATARRAVKRARSKKKTTKSTRRHRS